MDNNRIQIQLEKFNLLYKEMDATYINAVKTTKLTGSGFGILYFLRLNNKSYTQKELCDMMYQPKQSINSGLKKLEADGYIRLEQMENNMKNKIVVLTEAGEVLAQNTVDKVIKAEKRVFASMSDEERMQFIYLFEIFLKTLQAEFGKLDQ